MKMQPRSTTEKAENGNFGRFVFLCELQKTEQRIPLAFLALNFSGDTHMPSFFYSKFCNTT